MKNLRIFVVIVIAILSTIASAASKPSILVVSSLFSDPMGPGKLFLIDPVLENALKSKGYQVTSTYYEYLDDNVVNKFNVVIMVQEPAFVPEDPNFFNTYIKKTFLLRSYIERGGSVISFFDEIHYAHNWDFSLNKFLSPLGANVTTEDYGDCNAANFHKFEMIDSGQGAYRTSNFSSHPVTEGMKEWWYPRMTRVLAIDANWQVLVKGPASAYTAKTYKSEPVLLAVRNFGRGRVAAFPENSSFYVLNGFHRAYENGWMFNKGDGWKLFENLLAWLSEPSLQAGVPGGYKGESLPGDKVLSGYKIEEAPMLPNAKPMAGVVGIYTNYSGGLYSIKEFAERARELGLQFITLTDRIDSAAAWQKYIEECRTASDEKLIVMPGTEFTTSWHGSQGVNTGYALNIDKWPPLFGKTFVSVKLRSAEKYRPIITVAQPRENSFWPWSLGGFQGIEIVSARGNETFTSAVDWYKWIAGVPGVGYYPVVGHRIWNPEQLAEVKANGYTNYLYAAEPGKIRTVPVEGLVPGFASNGPIIDTFKTSTIMWDPWETYYLWSNGDQAKIEIRVHGDKKLKTVTLYSGKEVVRRFYPDARQFEQFVSLPMYQEGSFYVEVVDAADHKAISYTIPTRNLNFWNHIGSDIMNDYHTPVLPDENGSIIYKGQRYGFGGLVTLAYGWGNYLRFYHPVTTEAFHPLGYETGQIPAGLGNIRTYPKIYAEKSKEFVDAVTLRDCLLANRDVAVLQEKVQFDNHDGICKPSRYLDADTKMTLMRYRYRPFGYIIMQIEPKVTIKTSEGETIILDKRAGIEIGLIALEFMSAKSFKALTYVDSNGATINEPVDLTKDGFVKKIRIGKGGYFTLSPDPFGQVGLFAVDKEYDVELVGGARPFAWVGFDMDGAHVLNGKEFSGKLIVVEEGGGQGPEICQKLSELWGLRAPSQYKPKVASGKLVGEQYIIELNAQNYAAVCRFPQLQWLPNGLLPVSVHGINSNWSCGAVCDGKYYPAGSYGGIMYIGLENIADADCFLGNPVLCDSESVRIDIASFKKDAITSFVHNLSDQNLECHLWVNKSLSKEYAAVNLKLKPGQTQTIEFKKQ